MRKNGTRTIAPVDLGDAVPTSKDLSELPSVEDTIEVAREDAEANEPTAVAIPKKPWNRREIKARADARAVQELVHQLRRRKRSG